MFLGVPMPALDLGSRHRVSLQLHLMISDGLESRHLGLEGQNP